MIHDGARRRVMAMIAAASILPVGAFAASLAQSVTETITTTGGRRSSVTRWRAPRSIGTILFSHGALSAPWKYAPLIDPLVAAGWDVWAPLHVDSTDHPDTGKFPGLASWPARIDDMRALAKHVGAGRYVAAGHSYGGLVALTLGGAMPMRPPGIEGPLADPRASCVLAFSPPGPGMGLIDAAGYAPLARPALIQTGTLDLPPGTTSAEGWRSHLAAFDASAPGGSRYGLVLDGADHYFGGLICRQDRPGPRQQAQLDRAVAMATTFLRGYGAADRAAVAQLTALVGRGAGTTLYLR